MTSVPDDPPFGVRGAIALRALGAVLVSAALALGGVLHRLSGGVPTHFAVRFALAALIFLGWAIGSALLLEGRGLFVRLAVPGRF